MSKNRLPIVFERDAGRRQLFSIQELDSWAPYACENSLPELTGPRVRLRLDASNGVSDDIPCPEPSHVAAVDWLFAHQQALHDVIVSAIFEQVVPTLEPYYDGSGELFEIIPPIDSPEGLKQLIDLSYIDIFPHTKDGLPYLGFEFECLWDPEHGFQILMNGLRVVDLDGDVNHKFTITNDGGRL